jgi:N-formylglutamate amidohydrolase
LLDSVREAFLKLGYSVAINHPFAGTIVPLPYYTQEARVLSIMIEINRKLYMHEDTGEKGPLFARVKDDIATVASQIVQT